jgi:hypothetical protein
VTSCGPLDTEHTQERDRPEIADIFRRFGDTFRQRHDLTEQEKRVMAAICACRTSVLGGHVDVCDRCGHFEISYNSCRNRHCPECQALAQARWIEQRKQRILPTHYFHLVFTLPSELRALAFCNREVIYDLLFHCAAQTLNELATDPKRLGGQLGITAVLHTWTRELEFHPHIHCIVTGGGLTSDGLNRKPTSQDFLFPVKVLSRLFRGKLLVALRRTCRAGQLDFVGRCASLSAPAAFNRLIDGLFRKEWVVYAKKPFGGPEKVYEYLGRYTHRVAISNARMISIDGGVTFATKNGKTTTLAPYEFIRRFLMHILPKGLVKIRHFGLLAACNATTKLEVARVLLGGDRKVEFDAGTPVTEAPAPAPQPESDTGQISDDWKSLLHQLTGEDLRICPRCKEGRMIPLPLTWLSWPEPSYEDSS